jgi:hypothetical protein
MGWRSGYRLVQFRISRAFVDDFFYKKHKGLWRTTTGGHQPESGNTGRYSVNTAITVNSLALNWNYSSRVVEERWRKRNPVCARRRSRSGWLAETRRSTSCSLGEQWRWLSTGEVFKYRPDWGEAWCVELREERCANHQSRILNPEDISAMCMIWCRQKISNWASTGWVHAT